MSAEPSNEVRESRSVLEEPLIPHRAIPEKRRSFWWVWLIVLAAVGYALYQWYPNLIGSQSQGKGGGTGKVSAVGARAVPIVAVKSRRGAMPVYINGLGTVTALNTVTVHSRVDGELVNVAYQEGQYVKFGDLLAEIDPRPFQVQLAQAQGQLARDQAQLGQVQANLERDTAQQKYAAAEADRYRRLVEEGIASRDQGEQFRSTADALNGTITADRAAIDSAKAQIVADQGAIDNAKLQLTYSRITAPLAGRIGLRLVDRGNIVHAADANGLAVITQLQPIAVIFNIAEDTLRQVMPKFSAGVKFPVLAYDRDLRRRLADGMLLTIDNQVDPTTGTVKFKAVFENQDNALFPNQFVNARLLFDTRQNVVIIPTAALQRSPQSTFVYVVSSDQTVKVRDISTTLTEGDEVAVDKGLEAGEVVVVDGLDKLQEGTRVQVTLSGSGPGSGAPSGSKSGE
jgi:membrane fusion protein, multidrug efflux system